MQIPNSPVLIIPIFLFTCLTVTAIVSVVAKCWKDMHRQQIEAELKMEMLQLGMSADDIVRVIQARQTTSNPKENRVKNVYN